LSTFSWLMNEAFNLYIVITYAAHSHGDHEGGSQWRYYILGWSKSTFIYKTIHPMSQWPSRSNYAFISKTVRPNFTNILSTLNLVLTKVKVRNFSQTWFTIQGHVTMRSSWSQQSSTQNCGPYLFSLLFSQLLLVVVVASMLGISMSTYEIHFLDKFF
jgi:hypothetical protein